MPYFEFVLDGRFVIEAETEEKARDKVMSAESATYVDCSGEVEPYERVCPVCSTYFETFIYREKTCSAECWKEEKE